MYCINDNICVGDVILIKSASKAAGVITTMTQGNFSHVALVISKTKVIEAIGGGVKYSSLLRFLFEDRRNIRVLRATYRDKEHYENTIEYLRVWSSKYQGVGYNTADAIKSVLKLPFTINDDEYFCSHLVATLLNECQVELFKKKTFNVTPKDFELCDGLTDVSDRVISKVNEEISIKRAEKHGFQLECIDTGTTTSSQIVSAIRSVVVGAQKLFKKNSLEKPQRLWSIIEIITREDNVHMIHELDMQLTDIFDQNFLETPLIFESQPWSIDHYIEEFEEYGNDFAISEAKYSKDVNERMQIERKNFILYISLCEGIFEKFDLTFSSRCAAYYEFCLKNCIYTLQETENIIEAYKKYNDQYHTN